MRGYCIIVLAVCAVVFTPSAFAAGTPSPGDGCMLVAYTYDAPSHHWSIVREGASVVGEHLYVETDCPGEFQVRIDGNLVGGGTGSYSTPITLDTRSVGITGDNWSLEYGNLTVFPGADFAAALWGDRYLGPDALTLSPGDLETEKVIITVIASVMLWLMVTLALWPVVNYYIDRHLCTEVD